jgi:hypothetical protein
MLRPSSEKQTAQHRENLRKNLLGNYESPALTAELQAPVLRKLKHSQSMMTNPESIRGSSNSEPLREQSR